MSRLIIPDWPAPTSVRACSTTRAGGISLPPYDSLNLGGHVGDQPSAVIENRRRLVSLADLPGEPYWLRQVHGVDVLTLGGALPATNQADAVYTCQAKRVCAVMTADCLPVLLCNQAGTEVAAVHAGWRGLCAGIIENTLAKFNSPAGSIMAWLGPAIGPRAFEVGPEVREAFVARDAGAAAAFTPHGAKYLADIYHLARLRLRAMGISQIYGGDSCTVNEAASYFSYRRDGATGRMATLVWLI